MDEDKGDHTKKTRYWLTGGKDGNRNKMYKRASVISQLFRSIVMIEILIFVHVFKRGQQKFGILIVDVVYQKYALGATSEI